MQSCVDENVVVIPIVTDERAHTRAHARSRGGRSSGSIATGRLVGRVVFHLCIEVLERLLWSCLTSACTVSASTTATGSTTASSSASPAGGRGGSGSSWSSDGGSLCVAEGGGACRVNDLLDSERLLAVDDSVVVACVCSSGVLGSLELDGDLTRRLAVGSEAHDNAASWSNCRGEEFLQKQGGCGL